ncbi:hypothetical protein C5S53_10750 [Methanophagales archaeon]|nr:hypothetical protein C5S53_10750 [Methanophagales archaeon]
MTGQRNNQKEVDLAIEKLRIIMQKIMNERGGQKC